MSAGRETLLREKIGVAREGLLLFRRSNFFIQCHVHGVCTCIVVLNLVKHKATRNVFTCTDPGAPRTCGGQSAGRHGKHARRPQATSPECRRRRRKGEEEEEGGEEEGEERLLRLL